MAFDVRPLAASDRESWLPMWSGYLDFYDVSVEKRNPSDTWRRLVDRDHIYGLGAFLDSGELVGITHYLFHADTWTPDPACYLQDLFTRADVRGQGVGRALIAGVVAEAKARRCSRVYWMTGTENEVAMKLYDTVASLVPFAIYELDLTD